MSMFSLNANDSQQIGRRIFRRPMVVDASRFELCDISQTSGCPFARVMRRELRSAGITHHAVVFSPEPAMTPDALCAPPPGRRSVPGSLPWVPASAGLLLAQKIVLDLCAAPEERA